MGRHVHVPFLKVKRPSLATHKQTNKLVGFADGQFSMQCTVDLSILKPYCYIFLPGPKGEEIKTSLSFSEILSPSLPVSRSLLLYESCAREIKYHPLPGKQPSNQYSSQEPEANSSSRKTILILLLSLSLEDAS